jgi:hypothetical protein
MKNSEKYKTEQEIVNNIYDWCKSQPEGCLSCKYRSIVGNNVSKTSCAVLRLCDETVEPTPQWLKDLINKSNNKESSNEIQN